MARVKLIFPTKKPIFIAQIPLRIADMNYGNHLGNDVVLSIIHDARMQFLASLGHTELEVGGCGMIMADAMIAYRGEGYYGDVLTVEIFTDDISSRSFDFLYKITTQRDSKHIAIAEAKTGMVCYDYKAGKVCSIPPAFLAQLN